MPLTFTNYKNMELLKKDMPEDFNELENFEVTYNKGTLYVTINYLTEDGKRKSYNFCKKDADDDFYIVYRR